MPVQSMWQLRLTDSVMKGFRVRRQVSVPTVNLEKYLLSDTDYKIQPCSKQNKSDSGE